MSALVNLYVLAPAPATPGGGAAALAALARALLEAGLVRFPAAACAPLRERPAVPGLRTPQGVELLDPGRRREVPGEAALEAELARAAAEPVVLAFPAPPPGPPGAPAGPAGACALALYAFPGGHRLRLGGEGGAAPSLDETVTAWLHLQGEGAPRAAAFPGTPLERAVRSAWPGARVLEDTWD